MRDRNKESTAQRQVVPISCAFWESFLGNPMANFNVLTKKPPFPQPIPVVL